MTHSTKWVHNHFRTWMNSNLLLLNVKRVVFSKMFLTNRFNKAVNETKWTDYNGHELYHKYIEMFILKIVFFLFHNETESLNDISWNWMEKNLVAKLYFLSQNFTINHHIYSQTYHTQKIITNDSLQWNDFKISWYVWLSAAQK